MMKIMMEENRRMSIASNDRKEFKRWLFVFSLIFFITALVTRVLPRSLRPLASNESKQQSVYEEAVSAANNVVPFLFVAH